MISSMDKLAGKWKWRGKSPTKEKKQLKATAMEHREPLVDMYLKRCEELFEVFTNVDIGPVHTTCPLKKSKSFESK